ncbi:ESPR-type extended signal peptide-containing protein [Dyella subtropica]|uniref:ESPR-type extended signal peptide-containing protein n=1 Tax=Dyella subtropica TaxID=2992127 RepID=UPI002250C406|nr:YadA-like family protein [Dyella subtropica]
MNKIHSKVWSRALNQLVVASEIAACHRGGSQGQSRRRPSSRGLGPAVFTVLMASGGIGWTSFAQAQSVDCTAAPYNTYNGTASCMGFGAKASGTGATALGSTANASVLGALAVGYAAQGTGQNGIAVGFQAYANAINSVYLGARSAAGTGATSGGAIGIGTDVTASGGNAIGIGTQAIASGVSAIATGASSTATGNYAAALGYQANASADYATAIGYQTLASGPEAVAMGYVANGSGQHAVAIGFQSIASGLNAVYLGARTVAGTGATAAGAVGIGTDVTSSGPSSLAAGTVAFASAQNAVALGAGSSATFINDVAIGWNAKASGTSNGGAVALGDSTTAAGWRSAAVGEGANASSDFTTALGDSAQATGAGATAIGSNAASAAATASAQNAVAIGGGATASGNSSVALGTSDPLIEGGSSAPAAVAGAAASGIRAVAIGAGANAGGSSSIALGDSAQTGANADAIAMGTNATVSGGSAIALGNATVASNANTTAVGYRATASGTYATALGASATASGTGAIAIGANSLPSASANALGTVSVAIGNHAFAYNTQDLALGPNAVAGVSGSATITNDTAVGYNAQATGGNAFAGGSGSSALAASSVALGNSSSVLAAAGTGSVAMGNASTVHSGIGAVAIGQQQSASGNGAVAIGDPNTATGNGAIAMGANNTANGDGAVAMGNTNNAQGVGSIAIGNTSNALAAGAVAFGNAAAANNANDVALGSNSTTATAVGTPNYNINGTTYNFAGTTPSSTVSVGALNAERTITNVAAGRISGSSTDAINGSQLFATNQAVNSVGTTVTNLGNTVTNLGNTIATGIGGSTTYNPATGALTTNVTYGGATYSSLQQVFNQISGVVNGGGIKYFHANSALADSNAAGTNSVAIGPVSTASTANAVSIGNGATAGANAGDVALGSNSTTATAVGTPNYNINGTTYNFAGTTPSSTVSVGALNAERTITNVAAGRISGSSTDAINGSQLFATNQAVNSVGTTVTNLGNTVTNLGNTIATGIGGSTTYNPATGALTTNVTYGGATYSSLQQVFNQISGVVNGGGIKYFHANSALADSNAAGTNSVAIGPVSTASTANAVSIGNGATAGANAGDVALGSNSTTATAVGTPNYNINGTTYNFAGTTPSSTVSVGALNAERTITNVAAGRISGSSTDAINGSQLFGTNQAVNSVGTTVTNLGNTVTNLGNSIATSIGGSTTYNPATGALTTNVSYGGNTYSSLQQVFNQISGVVNGGGIKYFHANSALTDSNAAGANSVAIGPVSTASTANAVSIGNGATAGANAGDVALGSNSTTATAVGTPNYSINGTTYNFAGTTPSSTVSVGALNAERTITNVAAGRISGSSTDAINGSQLFATNQALVNLSSTVTASTTHYYSVNDNGAHGGNYTNNGATGLDALAAGVGAAAAADSGTALGQNTSVSVLSGVALGSGAVSDRAIAPSSGSILVGTNVVPYNTTDRTLLGAISVGNATSFRQITNVADGTQDQDAVTLRQLKGAMGSFSVTPIKYFHANSSASDSLATGAESVAVGPKTTVNGDNGIGVGNGAIVQQTAPGGTAIGQNATVNLADGVALGTNATSNGIQAMALGAGTQAAYAGSVALGAGSVTAAPVATASTILNGTTYNFAGTTPGSTVSVGAVGAERTITNVAAGRISGSSTDAINGSQLFSTNQALNTVGTTVTSLGNSIANSYGGSTTYNPSTGTLNTSITYSGATYSSLQQVFNQISGVVNGGGIKYFHANSTLADSNAAGTNSVAIGPVSTASTVNAVSIGNGATAGANAGDVALGAGSTTSAAVVTTGGTIDGHTYAYAGTAPTSTVSVGTAGAERTVTNVAAGQVNANSTDAINGSQLFATNQAVESLSSSVTAGATHYYSVNDNGTHGGNYTNNGATGLDALAAGVGAAATANSGTALGQNTSVSILGGVALGSGAVSDRAIAPSSGSILVGTNVVPYNTTDRTLLGAVSVGNATGFRQITNVADGTADQDAVTLRQLKGAMSSFSVTPIKYFHANSSASDSLAAGAESVAVGPKTTVNGDNGIGVGNGAIVQQTAPGGTAIGQNATVNLADGVALGTNATSNGIQAMALGAGTQAAYAGSVALGAGSVTAAPVATASTTLNGTTYNFAGTTPGSTVSVGAAGAERTLTNVAAGRISATSTDAINGSQLYATNQTLQQLGSQVINLSNTIHNPPPGGGGGGGTTITTYQTSSGNNTASSATGGNSTAAGAGSTASGNNSTAVGAGSTASGDNSVAVGTGSVASAANSVSVGSAGHERTVTNVAAGTAATDAVNVGQLSDAITQAKDWSKNYTDQRFQSVNRDLNRVGNRANAGVASAMAMASLPQAYQPNQSSAGVALGSFHGESGIAIGVSTISESGRYVFKLNATSNTRGDTGAGVGAGVVW